MTLQKDAVVDIPEKRVKYFGTTGKMLLPSPGTVAAVIENIPAKTLMTTELLLNKLTAQFDVQGTCPETTRKALKAIVHDQSSTVAHWRVINKNGGLRSGYPGGVEAQAARLREEGFLIDGNGKALKVVNFSENLVQFT